MNPSKTTIDWLAFRTQGEVRGDLSAMRPLFGHMGDLLNLKPLNRGVGGFTMACGVRLGDLDIGRVDFGGESQRGWARWNITGQGCEWVSDWNALQDVEALPRSEIRRLDIALTTWKGEVTHEVVEAAHAAGLFVCGGRPPAMQTIVSTDPRAGRTANVGQRAFDKFFRGYEKGFQLAAAMPPGVTHIDGFPLEDIYRCEVELKPKSTVIPWEVVERRDQYFAGCYPFLAELLPGVESDILMRRPERAPQADLKARLAHCRQAYGSTLFTALAAYGGDYLRVWDQICGDRHSADMLAAGVLMVDHE
jgi:phage replication initiation protein